VDTLNDFLREIPALIITLAVLIMATVLIIYAHVNIAEALAIVSPAIAFWFLGKAYSWQAPTTPPTDVQKPPN
jgi:hypothetical protein